jgi:hypothetical protein
MIRKINTTKKHKTTKKKTKRHHAPDPGVRRVPRPCRGDGCLAARADPLEDPEQLVLADGEEVDDLVLVFGRRHRVVEHDRGKFVREMLDAGLGVDVGAIEPAEFLLVGLEVAARANELRGKLVDDPPRPGLARGAELDLLEGRPRLGALVGQVRNLALRVLGELAEVLVRVVLRHKLLDDVVDVVEPAGAAQPPEGLLVGADFARRVLAHAVAAGAAAAPAAVRRRSAGARGVVAAGPVPIVCTGAATGGATLLPRAALALRGLLPPPRNFATPLRDLGLPHSAGRRGFLFNARKLSTRRGFCVCGVCGIYIALHSIA